MKKKYDFIKYDAFAFPNTDGKYISTKRAIAIGGSKKKLRECTAYKNIVIERNLIPLQWDESDKVIAVWNVSFSIPETLVLARVDFAPNNPPLFLYNL